MSEENGKRLTQEQREQVLRWIAEGLDSEAINQRASQEQPPFTIARSTLSHYRKTRAISFDQAQEQVRQAETAAIAEGYAAAAHRVERLSRLAEQLEHELIGPNNRLWLTQVKGIGRGKDYERIEYEEFNAAEVAAYRGILDDIAKETGGRIQRIQQEAEVDLIWDLPTPGWTPPAPAPAQPSTPDSD